MRYPKFYLVRLIELGENLANYNESGFLTDSGNISGEAECAIGQHRLGELPIVILVRAAAAAMTAGGCIESVGGLLVDNSVVLNMWETSPRLRGRVSAAR